jgi:UDP-N-acetylmuramoylalanine--D-glutamate ligase
MKIAILGFELEGKSALRYYSELGADITICDQDPDKEIPEGVSSRLGPDYLQGLAAFDIIFRTPGLAPKIILAANPGVESKITTGLNEFLRVCPSHNTIGITGTKGKGTTSTLTAHILQAAGKRVHLGGNIGVPPLDLLKIDILPDDWVVLELSSFQLIDLQYSPHIAVCLMVVSEHLDWHTNIEEYLSAKQRLFKHQLPDDITVYYADNDTSLMIASAGEGKKIPYIIPPGAIVHDGIITIDGQTICHTSEIKLRGEHNWQNVCAAVTAAWQITQDIPAMHSVIANFSGLEHRLEFVREVDGVKYYDDSFGTTPETAIVAIEAFSEPKVVILGGSDKGALFNDLAAAVKDNDVRKVVLIGDTAPQIQRALDEANYHSYIPGGTTMPEIVAAAQSAAKPGDSVLLSTGCASFGLFKNYKDRAAQFTAVVNGLSPQP